MALRTETDDEGDLITYPKIFRLGGETISPSHSMNKVLVRLGREKYTHHDH